MDHGVALGSPTRARIVGRSTRVQTPVRRASIPAPILRLHIAVKACSLMSIMNATVDIESMSMGRTADDGPRILSEVKKPTTPCREADDVGRQFAGSCRIKQKIG